MSCSQERISNLKAGLRTWEDHLNRVRGLQEELQREVEEIGQELVEAAKVLDEDEHHEQMETEERDDDDELEPEKEKTTASRGSTMQERLLECQVSLFCNHTQLIFPQKLTAFCSFPARRVWIDFDSLRAVGGGRVGG